MTGPILVTGGTGTLGQHLVPLLRASGHEVRVPTRREREAEEGVPHVVGDLLDDTGVEAAVEDVETVAQLAGGPKGDDRATETLVRAGAIASAARPEAWPTCSVPRCRHSPTSPAATWPHATSAVRSFRSGSRARRARPTGPGATST